MMKDINVSVDLTLNELGKLIYILGIEINNRKIRIINIDRFGQTTLASQAERRDLNNTINELVNIQSKLIEGKDRCTVQYNDNKEN